MGSQEHQHPLVIFDAWMQEAGESKQLAEEIESHIRERDSVMAAGADPSHHVLTAARRKLMVLGTKLDRLESLIHNPPTKPILSERDLHSRKNMILDMRQQLKQLALSLCTLQSSKNPKLMHSYMNHSLEENFEESSRRIEVEILKLTITKSRSNVQEAKANLQLDKEKATCPNNSSLNNFQGQNMKEKEPLCSETDKKHMVISVDEERNLQTPLLDSVDKEGNANQSSQGLQSGFLLASRCYEKCQLMINLFLIVVAIVIIVFIIGAAIESI